MPFVPDNPAPRGRFVPDDSAPASEPPAQPQAANTALNTAPGRAALGAAKPVLGVLQTQAEAGRAIGGKVADVADRVGLPWADTIRSAANSYPDLLSEGIQRLEREKGSAYAPTGGADEFAGQTLSTLLPVRAAGPGNAYRRFAEGGILGALAGMSNPVTEPTEDFADTKAGQVGMGAALGGTSAVAVPAALSAALWGGRKIADTARNVTDRFSAAGPGRIAERTVRDLVPEEYRNTLATALRSAPENVPFSAPTTAQAVSHTPYGTTLQGMEDAVRNVAGTAKSGSPSTKFNIRDTEQKNAIELAKAARDDLTAEMRSKALKLANQTTGRIQELGAQVRDRFLSKASALQDKGRFDTLAKKEITPVAGQPRMPNRYGYEREAGEASAEMTPIIRQRQAELEMAQRELDQLQQGGAKPAEIARVQGEIARIMGTPGLRASTVVQSAMDSVEKRLANMVEPDGTVNAADLYMLRKELGAEMEKSLTANASFDKKLAATLKNDLQESIDSVIEDSLPPGAKGQWREYLKTYADRSQAIDNEIARMEGAYKPNVRSNVSAHDADEALKVFLPATLSTPGMLLRSLEAMSGRQTLPRVQNELADMLLNPQQVADALTAEPPKRALAEALAKARRFTPDMSVAAAIGATRE